MSANIEDIPELAHLYNRQRPATTLKKTKHTRQMRSAFQVLVNPNVAALKLSPEEDKTFINEFYYACQHFTTNAAQFTKPYPGKERFKVPQLMEPLPRPFFERMDRDNRIHMHMFIQFDSVCYMDTDKIEAFFHSILMKWQPKKIFVTAKYVKSNQMLLDYFQKQQINRVNN